MELPEEAAILSHTWSIGAERWFVEVQPTLPQAAPLSVHFDGEDSINFTVGNIWFELFPVDTPAELAARAGEVARAVFRGHLEESGPKSDAYGRIFIEHGRMMGVGRVHLPWPWRLRPFKRRYEPYARPPS